MSLTLKHTYTFDSFVLDVDEQVLLRDGRMVPLTPKVFGTLLLLVQNQGSVVTKQTILSTLWPDVFVEESNITFNITKLRKALGDTGKPPIYIETVPRRGYRFKTEVRESLEENEGGPSELRPGVGANQLAAKSSSTELAVATTVTAALLPPIEVKRNFSKHLVVILLILLPLAGVATWSLTRRLSRLDTNANRRASQALTKAELKFEQISAYGNVVAAAISPDGKQVAYAQENTGHQSLWLMQLGTFMNVQLIPPGDSIYNK